MTHRSARFPRTARARGAALLVSWLAVVAVGSTANAAAAAGDAESLGTSQALHDTRATAAVGAVFHGPVSPAGDHFCSAGVVASPGRDLLVTAAHCVGGGTDDLYFAPGYHDGRTPYGVWKIDQVTVDRRWSAARDPDLDVAFATVRPLGGRRVEQVVGGFRLATGGPRVATVRLTGYPSAADTPLTCVNRTSAFGARQLRIACPAYGGGTSGSPWVAGGRSVLGVIGGFQQGGTTADVSYSPVFGAGVAALYRAAVAGS